MTPYVFVKDLFKFCVKTYKIFYFWLAFFPKIVLHFHIVVTNIFKNSNSCYLRYIVIIAVVQQKNNSNHQA